MKPAKKPTQLPAVKTDTALAPSSTPAKLLKFFLVFFICVVGYAVIQKLGGVFGLFTQLSNRFKKAWAQFSVTTRTATPMALTHTSAPLTTDLTTTPVITTPEVVTPRTNPQRSRQLTGPSGTEFQVNTYTTSDQKGAAITHLNDGGFVVVWYDSDGQDGSSYGVYGQRYAALGTTVGSEFQINTYTSSIQYNPSIARLTDGSFVVVWESNEQDGHSWGVYGKRYNAAGAVLSGEFQINTYTASYQSSPIVASLADSGFVVVWESDGKDGSGYGVYSQRYDATGVTVGTEFRVNSHTTNSQHKPSIASLGDGSLMVVWQSGGQDGSSDGVYGQRYAATGAMVGAEFRVNTYTSSNQYFPSIAGLNDGGFVVVWSSIGQDGSSDGVYGQRYNATGSVLGSEFQVNTYTTSDQSRPSIASFADGGFVVVWMSDGQDGSSYGVYGQRYAATGATVGAEFRVNTYTTGSQQYPSIAGLNDGGFVVAWESDGQDGDGFGILGQRYNAGGQAIALVIPDPTSVPSAMPTITISPTSIPTSVPSKPDSVTEFQVNTYTTNDQRYPKIASLADGGFVVVWESNGQDSSNYGGYGQRYDALGMTVGGEFQVNTYTTSDQQRPAIAHLNDGGFVVVWQSDGQDGSSYGVYGQRYGATGSAVGNEFQVNTYTTSDQSRPSIASLTDGGFVVVWMSDGQDGSSWGVYGQRYNATGNTVDSEFQVNTYTTNHQGNPSIASLTNGGFVVVWQSLVQDGSDEGVFGQRYNATGSVVGSEFQANTYTTGRQGGADIASLADGSFVVVWEGDGQDGSNHDVYGQRYNATGATVGAEFRVNTYTSSTQSYAAITSLADGGFVVVWMSHGQDGSVYGIYGQRYDATGVTVGAEFRVNTFTWTYQYYPSIAGLNDGGFVVAWESNVQDSSRYGIFGQQYDSVGRSITRQPTSLPSAEPSSSPSSLPSGLPSAVPSSPSSLPTSVPSKPDSVTEFQVNTYTTSDQKGAAITHLNDGGFVVVWHSNGQDGSLWGVYGQRYDALGMTVGGEFQVNTYTTSDQSWPDIASLADGGFVVVWNSDGQDGSSYGVYGQRYGATGSAVGNEFQVNIYTTSDQRWPDIAGLDDGGFVVVWNSLVQDGSGLGVFGQRYNTTGAAVGSEFQANTYTTNNQAIPSIAGLTNCDFVVVWYSEGQDGSSDGVYGQRYNATGATVGAEFRVNTYTSSTQSYAAITSLAGGGFVVVWMSHWQDGSDYGIYGQRYDATGATVGAEFRVNTFTWTYQYYPSIAGLNDGGFVVAWESNTQDGSRYGIFGQQYDSVGRSITRQPTSLPSAEPSGAPSSLPSGLPSAVPSSPSSLPTSVPSKPESVTEFQVNTYTTSDQKGAAITHLNDGGFVVVWHSNGQDGSNYGVYGQRYDALGMTVGSEFQVNSYTSSFQGGPSIASLTDGGFVVVWQSDAQDGSTWGVYGQRYDALGETVGSEFQVNSYVNSRQSWPDIASLADGGFVAVWRSNGQDGSGYGVYGQRYNSTGADVGSEFQVNTYTSSNQYYPSIAGLNDGGFVVAWESDGQDGDGFGIFGQQYDSFGRSITRQPTSVPSADPSSSPSSLPSGLPSAVPSSPSSLPTSVPSKPESVTEFQVNTYITSDQQGAAITHLNDGGFVVVWRSNDQDGSANGIYGQRYNALGMTVGSEFQINTYVTGDQSGPSIASLADGSFVVVWNSYEQDGSGWGVYGQPYNATGNAVGSEFQVNTYTTSSQSLPSIASLVDGGFVVVWNSDGQDGSNYGVYGQRYDATGVTAGSEFRVNTYTSSHQWYPSITGLNGGGFVVVWASNGQDGSVLGVFGQRYDALGMTYGSEFQVNTYTINNQNAPSISSLANGGFVVVWHSNGQDGSGWGVYGQRYDATGSVLGGEFQVNTYTTSTQSGPSIASLADGGFVVAWYSYGQDGSERGVYGQRYDATGATVGAEFRVNTYTTSDQLHPSIAGLNDGGFVVAWESDGQDGSGYGIFGQQYDSVGRSITRQPTSLPSAEPSGAPSSLPSGLPSAVPSSPSSLPTSVPSKPDSVTEFQVNTYTTSNQEKAAIAHLNDGGFVVVWDSYGQDGSDWGVFGQRYDALGMALGSEFQVNTYTTNGQNSPDITSLADGCFMVVWQSFGQDGSSWGVYGQHYNVTGSVLGSEFQINTYVTGDQSGPSIASLADGGFVLVWSSNGQDGSSYGVYGQRYNTTGAAVGSEFQVNTFATNEQSRPDIASFADGGFVVVWHSNGQDGSLLGVYGQRYDALGMALGSEFQVNTYTSSSQYQPEVASFADGGFVVVWMSNGQDGSANGIYGQRYDATGSVVGSEFQVNTYTASHQSRPRIASLADSGFVVVWMSDGQDGSNYGVYGQRYGATGVTVGAEFRVNTNTWTYQYYPSIAGLNDGGFVVAWESNGQDGDGYGIFGQQYDSVGRSITRQPTSLPSAEPSSSPSSLPSGLPSAVPSSPSSLPTSVPSKPDSVTEFQVNTYTASDQQGAAITHLNDGGFVVVWMSQGQDGSGWGVYGQRYDALGMTVGSEFQINTYTTSAQSGPSIASLDDGGFVVAWHSIHQDGSYYGVYGQRYNTTGAAVGSEFQINTYTTSAQSGPSIASLDDGGFVVVWQSDGQDGSGWGVFGQRYNITGATLGSEFQVNTYTTSHQEYPGIASLDDGGFVVVWQSDGQDSSGWGVYCQRYNATAATLGNEFQVNTYTTSHQDYPSVASLADGGFVVV